MPGDRVCRVYWGPGQENVLDFNWPVAATEARTKRTLRDGSRLESKGAAALAWVTGRDYRLTFKAQYFGADRYSGAVGLQAFLDWAAEGSNTFTLVPDQLQAPSFQVAGCFLAAPFLDPGTTLDPGGDQTVELEVLHPTIDLALAWRGLMFRYAPTADDYFNPAVPHAFTGGQFSQALPNDPTARAGAAGYWTGAGLVATATGQRQRHFPLGYGSAVKTALFEGSGVNWLLQSQALATSPWLLRNGTITNNDSTAPDGTTTATKYLPNITGGVNHYNVQPVTITANENLAASCFVKASSYTCLRVWVADTEAGTNGFRADFSLIGAGATSGGTLTGTGTFAGAAIVPLAFGWYWVGVWGTIGNGATTSQTMLLTYPTVGVAGAPYAGDGTSFQWLWGAQLERNGTANGYIPPTSYMPTITVTASRPTDGQRHPFPWAVQPMFAYAKVIDLGIMSMGNLTGYCLFTSNGMNQGRLFQIDALSGGQWRVLHDNGVSNAQSTANVGSNYGDVHEVLMVLNPNGSVQAIASRNGGAPVVGAVSAALAFSPSWLGPRGGGNCAPMISLAGFSGGLTDRARGLIELKIGPLSFAGRTASAMQIARAA